MWSYFGYLTIYFFIHKFILYRVEQAGNGDNRRRGIMKIQENPPAEIKLDIWYTLSLCGIINYFNLIGWRYTEVLFRRGVNIRMNRSSCILQAINSKRMKSGRRWHMNNTHKLINVFAIFTWHTTKCLAFPFFYLFFLPLMLNIKRSKFGWRRNCALTSYANELNWSSESIEIIEIIFEFE